jgi:hypothetical protein
MPCYAIVTGVMLDFDIRTQRTSRVQTPEIEERKQA